VKTLKRFLEMKTLLAVDVAQLSPSVILAILAKSGLATALSAFNFG